MDIKFCETLRDPGITAAPWERPGIYEAGIRICGDWMGVCKAVGTGLVYTGLDGRM